MIGRFFVPKDSASLPSVAGPVSEAPTADCETTSSEPAPTAGDKRAVPETAPQAAPAVQAPAPPLPPARQDWWVAGGLTVFPSGGVVGYRMEAGRPWPVEGYPGLRLLMVMYFNHWSEQVSVPGLSLDMSASTLALFPSAQYDFAIAGAPIGRISILPELGLGPAVAWVRMPDLPFMPGHYETHYATVARLAGSLQLATPSGFLVVVQPAAAYFSMQSATFDGNFEIGPQAASIASCAYADNGSRKVNVSVSDERGCSGVSVAIGSPASIRSARVRAASLASDKDIAGKKPSLWPSRLPAWR